MGKIWILEWTLIACVVFYFGFLLSQLINMRANVVRRVHQLTATFAALEDALSTPGQRGEDAIVLVCPMPDGEN